MRVVLFALLLSGAFASSARGQFRGTDLRRWLRPRTTLRTAVWSSSRTVDDRSPLTGSMLWTELAPSVESFLKLKVGAWLGAGSLVGRVDPNASLRELYGDLRLGAMDVRLGKQIVAWGRADAVNPTDNLSPHDLTLLVPDDDDQKIGVSAARVSVYDGGTTLTALWLAGFSGNTLPLEAPPSGTRLARRMPGHVAAQGALRLERSGGRVDWSASYFSGFDLNPDIALRVTAGDTAFELAYHRLHAVGADAATTLGRYGVRAEAAWIGTEDRGGADPEIKNSSLYAVIGADRTFGGYFNVNVQYLLRRVSGFTSPDGVADPARREAAVLLARVAQQLRGVQQGATFRVSNQWRHETLKAELAGVFLAPPWQFVVRPRASYAATDHWEVRLGADLWGGGRVTLFRELRSNSGAFIEVRLGL